MDLNEDGIADILSGCYSGKGRNMAGHFQVLWGTKDKGFRKPEVLNGTDGKPLVISGGGKNVVRRICTRPFAVDWDGDGDLDIVTGNFEGGFHLFTGEGKGRFLPESQPLTCEKGELRLPRGNAHSDPFVVDWDGDGGLDILSGSSDGGIYLAENEAGKGKQAKLKAFSVLVPEPKPESDRVGFLRKLPEHPAGGVRIWVADVDGDGDLDILAGDRTTVAYAAKGLDKETFEKKLAAIEKERKELEKKLFGQQSNTDRQKLQEQWTKLYEKRSKLLVEENTGFVWLYRRQ